MRLQALFFNTFFLVFFSLSACFAQNGTLFGRVTAENSGDALTSATVAVINSNLGVFCNEFGKYELSLPSGKHIVNISYVGFLSYQTEVTVKTGERLRLDVILEKGGVVTDVVTIYDKTSRSTGVVSINPKIAGALPNPSGNFESILQAFGARSNNEFSSQYSVRGGNFDENLIYINDIEIYRPILMRSGQQEGMSIINSNLVDNIRFSAGGFEAKYGDKLSSSLDIKYKRPDTFYVKVMAGIMGGQITHEDVSNNHKWRFLTGIRYRTISNLLSSLDTKGDYKPTFGDAQTWITYQVKKNHELGILAHFSMNDYVVKPLDRETTFGTAKEALQLKVFFEGREQTGFKNGTVGLNYKIDVNPRTTLKFLAYGYHSNEKESFDIEGAYRLDQLESDLGSKDFGKVIFNRGVGGFQNWARNQLKVWVGNLEHKGIYTTPLGHTLQWGIRWQTDKINDRLYEWVSVDSSGFIVPMSHSNDTSIVLEQLIYAKNTVQSNRFMGYLQETFLLDQRTDLTLTAGIRYNYWTFNNQLLISPRLQLSIHPNWNNDVVFRLQGGIYQQQAFYREMRNYVGEINTQIRAQKSSQVVAASDWSFNAWGRPLRFVTEAWYKNMWDVIPYEVDNVRVRYFATNNSKAYATGLDFRVNGEFVKSLESWASLSFLKTAENLSDDFYYNSKNERIEPGYIPRPSDQRMIFSLMFQDFLPKNPSYKVNLNLVYGTGLPFGPPDNQRWRDTNRMPHYKRVDIGFSKQIIGVDEKGPHGSVWKSFKSLWASFEVFNLLQSNNTISYLWVRDSQSNMYAVPNYLSSRILNFRISAEF